MKAKSGQNYNKNTSWCFEAPAGAFWIWIWFFMTSLNLFWVQLGFSSSGTDLMEIKLKVAKIIKSTSWCFEAPAGAFWILPLLKEIKSGQNYQKALAGASKHQLVLFGFYRC